MGKRENTPKNLYIHRALSLVDAELELLNLKITHPEQFNSPVPTGFESDLYVLPKSKELGIIGITEIVLTLFLLGKTTEESGKPIPKIQLVRGFERLFDLKFGSICDKIDGVFTRKPYNLTKTLDTLRNAVAREDRKRRNK